MVQDDPRPGRESGGILRAAGEVLPEIQHGFPGGGMDHFPYGQAVLHDHRQAVPVRQRKLRQQHGRPVRVLLFRPKRPIQGFAVVDIRGREIAAPVAPVSVRGDNLLRSVRQADPQLGQDPEPVSVHFTRAFVAQPALVPAVPGKDFNPVFPGAEQRAHVAGQDLDRFAVIVAERSQQVAACFFTVQVRFEQAQSRHVQPGGYRLLRQRERPEEHGMETVLFRGSDPFPGPRLLLFPGFEPGVGARPVPGVSRHFHPAVIPGARRGGQGDFLAGRAERFPGLFIQDV